MCGAGCSGSVHAAPLQVLDSVLRASGSVWASGSTEAFQRCCIEERCAAASSSSDASSSMSTSSCCVRLSAAGGTGGGCGRFGAGACTCLGAGGLRDENAALGTGGGAATPRGTVVRSEANRRGAAEGEGDGPRCSEPLLSAATCSSGWVRRSGALASKLCCGSAGTGGGMRTAFWGRVGIAPASSADPIGCVRRSTGSLRLMAGSSAPCGVPRLGPAAPRDVVRASRDRETCSPSPGARRSLLRLLACGCSYAACWVGSYAASRGSS